ncbi:MAG: PilZ domain-containing protein [Thermoanaerobaculia bacterium]|nr:PilZ domain-containing protein [Thermoanaerobaculia bacterium]
MVASDRRRFQRLKLGKPILAMMDGENALILDIGVSGAFVEHHGKAKTGDRFTLTFFWQGDNLEFLCEMTRTSTIRPAAEGQNAVSHSGVRFIEGARDSVEKLQGMMASFVGRLLAAQRANASAGEGGDGAAILAQMGQARRLRTRGFISYRWNGKSWKTARTSDGKQPLDGFTVAAYEDEEELETLCEAYQTGDDESRTMIRLVAELSVLSGRK